MRRRTDTITEANSPKLELQRAATLDGDMSTLTITYKNQTKGSHIDVVLNGLALGNVEPNEKSDIPIRIAQLPPA
jgi:hypothetical protein